MLQSRRHVGRTLWLAACGCIVALSTMMLAGCKKTEPEPTGSGYYTGPMKPKVSPFASPGAGAQAPNAKGEAAPKPK